MRVTVDQLRTLVRQQIQEYGDHETQAAGGMVSSSHSSDPEMDQVEDIAMTVIEQGGQLMQIANALKNEGFDARMLAGALVIDDKYFIGKASKFEIDPSEDVREVGPYVLGGQYNQMEEVEKLSPEDKEWHKSVMDKGKVPNLKGDMGPLPGMEGPFQFKSGAVLYYDPKEGAYYDRGKDMYIDRDEAAALTMENETVPNQNKTIKITLNTIRDMVRQQMQESAEEFQPGDHVNDIRNDKAYKVKEARADGQVTLIDEEGEVAVLKAEWLKKVEGAPKIEEGGAPGDPAWEALRDLGLFLAKLINEGYDELAAELDQIVVKMQKAGIEGEPPPRAQAMGEADEGGEGVHDIFNMPEPEAVESTGNPKEDALRQIVAQSQAAKVDGVMVDGYTASAIVQILDALKPETKEKYLQAPIQKMAMMAMKMVKEDKLGEAHEGDPPRETDPVQHIGDAIFNNGFMNARDALEKAGFKADFVTSPLAMWMIEKDGVTYAALNSKYAEDPDLTVDVDGGSIAIGVMNENKFKFKNTKLPKILAEVKSLLENKLKGVHPLIDGMYSGNGSAPHVFRRIPQSLEIMRSNPEVEEFKLALSILDDRKPIPYIPFGFEEKIAAALEKVGGAPEDEVQNIKNWGMNDDDEWNPPGW